MEAFSIFLTQNQP